ncbi:MAG: histidine phosphatase family protein [Actinomycetota bacterium]
MTTFELGAGETLLTTIRHGLTLLNRDQRVGGRIDVPLIDEGRLQAKEAAAALDGATFDAVISSPLQRALETASLVTGLSPSDIEVNEECTERSFGQMEGVDPAEVPVRFPQVRYLQIGDVRYSLNPPDGESFDALHRRAAWFLEATLKSHRGENVLVLSHQNFLQQLHGAIKGLGPIESLAQDILNCELNRFRLGPDGALLDGETVQLCGNAARYPSF